MKQFKFIIPMLAFVLAIGMSFAVEHKATGDLVLEINGVKYHSPVDCQGQGEDCTAWISKDGDVQEIQVKRETSPGVYEEAFTSVPNTTVYAFSSLIPVTP
ncbi:DUF6520 family protein [Galbibacter sp.]|uniref:DUF6520 family protein n=1 Tax=Galbibacter sp. TaxID=2918471 RepID=UPI003A950176